MPRFAALEISEHDVKVVQLAISPKHGVQLERAVQSPLPDEDRGAALKAFLRKQSIRAQDYALVVPKQSTTLRKVRLPSQEPDELASMTQFEAEKIIPFNVERHIINHVALADAGLEGTDVLMGAIDEVVMEPWLQTLSGAGVEPVTAMVSSLELGYALFSEKGKETARGTVAILQVGMMHTDISLYSDGEIVTSRSVRHGVQNLLNDLQKAMNSETPLDLSALEGLNALRPETYRSAADDDTADLDLDEDDFKVLGAGSGENAVPPEAPARAIAAWLSKLKQNVQRSYEFSLREFAVPPLSRMYLTGEGAMIEGLPKALESQLGVQTEVFDPVKSIPRAEGAVVDEAMSPGFSAVLGAALQLARSEGEGTLNLLPPSLLERRRRSEMTVHYSASGALLLVALLMVGLWFWNKGDQNLDQLQRYEEYTGLLNEKVHDLEEMKARMQIISRIRSERAGALQILEAISTYPQLGPTTQNGRVTLRTFEFQIGMEVRVRGHALEIDDINQFIYYLRELRNPQGQEIFEAIDILTQNPVTLSRRDRTVYEFELVGALSGSQGRLR